MMDASDSHALETHGAEELSVEATEHIVKLSEWREAAALAVQDHFFIPVIVRICQKATEPLTNFFV